MNEAAYDQDLYTWSLQQAHLLREPKFDQADWRHIIEEIEDVSKSEKSALFAYALAGMAMSTRLPSGVAGNSPSLSNANASSNIYKKIRD